MYIVYVCHNLIISSSDSRAHKHEVTEVIYLIKDKLKIYCRHHFKRVQWREGVTLTISSHKKKGEKNGGEE